MTLSFGKPIFPILVALAVLLMLSMFMLLPVTNTTSFPGAGTTTITQDDSLMSVNATIVELLNGHAYERHGVEVNAAFKCLNDKGSTKSFKTFGFIDERGNPLPTNMWLCFDGKDWYAIVTTTLEKVGGNRIGRLVTAYMIDKVKFSDIDMFITSIKNQWRAIEINFIVEAGSVFLQPK